MRRFQNDSPTRISRIALYVTMVLFFNGMIALTFNCDENHDADNCVESLYHL